MERWNRSTNRITCPPRSDLLTALTRPPGASLLALRLSRQALPHAAVALRPRRAPTPNAGGNAPAVEATHDGAS